MHSIQMLGLLEQDVLSSIEIPLLPERKEPSFTLSRHGASQSLGPISKQEADEFDHSIFALKLDHKSTITTRSSSSSTTIMASSYRSNSDRRSAGTHRNSVLSARSSRIAPIEESPRHILVNLPNEDPPHSTSVLDHSMAGTLSSSPSQFSMHSVKSSQSSRPREASSSRINLASRFAPSWLLSTFRSAPSEPQTSPVAATGSTNVTPSATPNVTPTSKPIRLPAASPFSRTPRSNAISISSCNQSTISYGSSVPFDEDKVYNLHSYLHHSPLNTPPRGDSVLSKRSVPSTAFFSSSPSSRSNPSRPRHSLFPEQTSLARQWQHLYPGFNPKHRVKWKSIITPAGLPLTVDFFPTAAEIESLYDVSLYDFVIDPPEMRPTLVKTPTAKGSKEDVQAAWALLVMRGMVAVRLAQGFQFVIRPTATHSDDRRVAWRPKASIIDDDLAPKPAGASEVLKSTRDPVYLSMSNEIHRLSWTGEAVQVQRYVRRMSPLKSIKYQCLIWPKLGEGYIELETSFATHGLENYGWNRCVYPVWFTCFS
jgi:hypothetical protein